MLRSDQIKMFVNKL